MSEATQTEAQLPEVEDLGAGSVGSNPHDYTWTDHEGFGEEWESYEAGECEECGEVFSLCVGCGDGTHHETAEEEGSESDCTGYVPLAEGPMMSYFYPIYLPVDLSEEDAAKRLAGLPLAVVTFAVSDTTALALTGGGMNLAWEICEGFIRLEQLPPLHFCDLPEMGDRGAGAYSEAGRARDRRIIEACVASCEHARMTATRTGERVAELLTLYPKD